MANKIKTLNRSGLSREILFNGNALDTSGNGGNGTATNVTYTTTNRGYQTQMASFNGSNSTVTLGTLTASTFSVSFLFTPTDTANQRTLFEMDNSSNTAMFSVLINSNQLRLNTYDGLTFNDRTLSGLSANITYNIAITVSGGTANFYLNGQFVGAHVINNITYGGNNTSIGYRQRTSQYYYTGTLQTFRFNTSIISDEEIRNRYLEGLRYLGGQSYGSLFDSIYAYYDFNGDALDIIGSNNGTVSGATLTTDMFGGSNSAYNFDGTNDVISAGTYDITGTQNFTFAVRFKLNSLPTYSSSQLYDGLWLMGMKENSTSARDKGIVINKDGYIRGYAYDGSPKPTSSTQVISTGTYYEAVMTYNGSTLTMYVDGVSVGTSALSSSYNFTTPTIVWSQVNNNGTDGDYLDGVIDYSMILLRALSADEVKILNRITSTSYPYPF